jgi:hypothetical protein
LSKPESNTTFSHVPFVLIARRCIQKVPFKHQTTRCHIPKYINRNCRIKAIPVAGHEGP